MQPCDKRADMTAIDGLAIDPIPPMENGMSTTLWPRGAAVPSEFRFIDLFAGIGGLRLGLEGAGGRCVYSIDEADVRSVDPVSLPEYDVLAAGFPCQPCSIAGVSKKASLGREHGFA